ncbi:MAG: hypothetical protein AABO41_04650 [Acidobacteriota bacterium]
MKDPRPPLLYLRSFLYELPNNFSRLDLKTEEQMVASVLRDLGPVVAVGQPGETLPPFSGMLMVQFDGSVWKEEVLKLMLKAQLIVINPGLGENLKWEISTARRGCAPEKLIVPLRTLQSLDPRTRKREWTQFRKVLESSLGVSMPDDIRTAAFLHFEADWSPRFVGENNWAHKMYGGRVINVFLGDGSVVIIRETLRRILKKRGLRLNRLGVLKDIGSAALDNLAWWLVMLMAAWGFFRPAALNVS